MTSTEGTATTAAALQEKLRQMIMGFNQTQLAYVAARLGIADLLIDGPRSSDELARATGTHASTLLRILRGLATMEIVAQEEDGRFGLAPLGVYLQEDTPGSLRSYSIMTREARYPAWGAILHTVETGEPAFDHVFGESFFDYLERNPELNTGFRGGRTAPGGALFGSKVAALTFHEFSQVRVVVDEGGSTGHLLAAVLKQNPHLKGVLFDMPHVITGARQVLDAAGVAGRCALEGGSFFDTVPTEGDAYILSAVLHDWDDERCIRILGNCRRALAGEGSLLIVERLMPERVQLTAESVGVISTDLEMLRMSGGGRERTQAEFAALLGAAGFTLTSVSAPARPYFLIEAVPQTDAPGAS